ncbi:hypothetical protein CR513_24951, partial [Mucuna pruriens]
MAFELSIRNRQTVAKMTGHHMCLPTRRAKKEMHGLITLPPQRKSPQGADKAKYCKYHKNHGHTTEACRMLRDKIKELEQISHLRKFVQREADREDHDNKLKTNHRGDTQQLRAQLPD